MKALALFSGGLDSILAIKLLQDKGIDVIAFHFHSEVLVEEIEEIEKTARKLNVELIIQEADSEYYNMLKKSNHGYGKAINPCIDCRIFILKKAKEIADKRGIDLIVTGEVLGERPMTQNKRSLEVIEKESGLKGRILRPLSSEILPKITDLKFLSIEGRTRKKQLELAKKYNLKDYPTPAGGCLLTQKEFAPRVRDLLNNEEKLTKENFHLLNFGRHFRYKKSKIIVGRNEQENKELLENHKKEDIFFNVPDYGSPITLLQGEKNEESILMAAKLTARYCDSKEGIIKVKYGKRKPIKTLSVSPATQKEIDKYIL